MSDTVLTFTHTVDGTPTDADSVVLADPTNTFGVQRKDNNSIVVSAGAPLTRVSAGVYRFSFLDPSPNLVYRYFVKLIYLGNRIFYERETSMAPAAMLDITGRYASYAGMRRKVGDINLTKWASVNGSEDNEAIKDAIESAIYAADEYVDSLLAGGPYAVPFQPVVYNGPLVASDNSVIIDSAGNVITVGDLMLPRLITESANCLAVSLLYEAQGFVDYNPETGAPQHRYAFLRDMAIRNLARIKSARVRVLLPDGSEYLQSSTVPAAGIDPEYVPGYLYMRDSEAVWMLQY